MTTALFHSRRAMADLVPVPRLNDFAGLRVRIGEGGGRSADLPPIFERRALGRALSPPQCVGLTPSRPRLRAGPSSGYPPTRAASRRSGGGTHADGARPSHERAEHHARRPRVVVFFLRSSRLDRPVRSGRGRAVVWSGAGVSHEHRREHCPMEEHRAHENEAQDLGRNPELDRGDHERLARDEVHRVREDQRVSGRGGSRTARTSAAPVPKRSRRASTGAAGPGSRLHPARRHGRSRWLPCGGRPTSVDAPATLAPASGFASTPAASTRRRPRPRAQRRRALQTRGPPTPAPGRRRCACAGPTWAASARWPWRTVGSGTPAARPTTRTRRSPPPMRPTSTP